MNKTLTISLLILLMLVAGWVYIFLELPFFEFGFALMGTSLLIMAFLRERFVFLYAIIIVLGYGAFLTTYAFSQNYQNDIQSLFIYSHLLVTSFVFLYWILLNLLKQTHYENEELRQKVKLLEKYSPKTKVLTINEFRDQARYMFRLVERHKEEAWLVTLLLVYENKKVRENLQESIERVSLQTIRQEYDLVTGTEGRIYLLLMSTTIDGAKIVVNRLRENLKAELNFLEEPYEVDYMLYEEINLMDDLIGGIK
jgi:hypothetical protein